MIDVTIFARPCDAESYVWACKQTPTGRPSFHIDAIWESGGEGTIWAPLLFSAPMAVSLFLVRGSADDNPARGSCPCAAPASRRGHSATQGMEGWHYLRMPAHGVHKEEQARTDRRARRLQFQNLSRSRSGSPSQEVPCGSPKHRSLDQL